MTPEEDRKLYGAFYEKFRELAFKERTLKDAPSWRTYIESVGCRQVPHPDSYKSDPIPVGCHESDAKPREWEIIDDPSPFGGYILVPKELSLNILALGLP